MTINPYSNTLSSEPYTYVKPSVTEQEFFACYQEQFDLNQEFGYPILSLAQFAYDMLQEACQNSDYDSDHYLDHCMAIYEYYESNIAG